MMNVYIKIALCIVFGLSACGPYHPRAAKTHIDWDAPNYLHGTQEAPRAEEVRFR